MKRKRITLKTYPTIYNNQTSEDYKVLAELWCNDLFAWHKYDKDIYSISHVPSGYTLKSRVCVSLKEKIKKQLESLPFLDKLRINDINILNYLTPEELTLIRNALR